MSNWRPVVVSSWPSVHLATCRPVDQRGGPLDLPPPGCSATDGEDQVGDPVAVHRRRRLAEQRRAVRDAGEVRAAGTEHDRYEVDGHLVQQAEIEALAGDRPR